MFQIEGEYSPQYAIHKHQYIAGLLRTRSIGITEEGHSIQLRERGENSTIYIDSANAFAVDGKCFDGLVQAQAEIVRHIAGESPILLVNVDSKASGQLTGALGFLLGASQAFYTSEGISSRERGLNKQLRIAHTIEPNTHVFVIDDVITHGDTQMIVVDLLRERLPVGLDVHYHLIAGLFRGEQRDINELSQKGVDVITVTTLEDLILYLM